MNAFRHGTYVAKQYTILNAAGGRQRHVRFARQHQSARRLQVEPELRCQQRLSRSGADLRAAAAARPERQPAERRQRASINFFNTTGGIPLVFGALTPAGLDAGLGRDRDRLAADHVQRHEPVHGRDDRSVHCRAAAIRSAAAAIRMPMPKRASPMPARSASRTTRWRRSTPRRRRLRRLRAALERVGGGLWRIADAPTAIRSLGSNNTRSSIYGRRCRRRLPHLAEHAGGLCAGRRRHQFQRQWIWHRPLRPVPGRRVHPAQCRRRPISPARWPMAGRTSPPIAR